MDGVAEARSWAEQQFGTAQLGDERRTRRLVHSAMKIALHPEKSFNQVFDWNELRGFYNLCDREEVSFQAVLQPHWNSTREAMGQHAVVLIVHDTTELDFSKHRKLTGTGQIGNENGKGFLQHNSLAVVPGSRQVLGLAYQQLIVRQPAPEGESAYQRKRRARESDLWLEGIRASGKPPEGCCWVDVCDRGSDDYEAMRAARALEHHFLIRAAQNRIVYVSAAYDQEAYVLDYARSLSSVGCDQVHIPGRGGRPARTATVALAAAPVWVPAPAGTLERRSQPILAAWIIRIWEANPPADVAEPVEWILWCSLPTQTLAELQDRRDWYCQRWLVEVYHHIEKNGCSEEDRRFETADRMATCLALLAVVAVRVFQLRNALDHQPDAPAEQVGTKMEIEVVRRLGKHKEQRFTVRDFVRGVAKLGGFLGRKHDGNPGVLTLWRGYQRLQDMLEGFQLSLPDRRQTRKDPGNR
jgi:Transposase DNA-binding/Transposase Tn5 dimerisation domain